MKTQKFPLFLFAAAAILLAGFAFSGCEKELPIPTASSPIDRLPAKFKRTVELQDGQNKIVLGIASDTPSKLDDFEASVMLSSLEATPQDNGSQADGQLPPSEETALQLPPLSEAVHICILEEHKAPGTAAIQLRFEAAAAGKAETTGAYTGFHVFYSWEAPHYFRISAYPLLCNDFFIFRVPNGGSNWFQTSQGRVCNGSGYTWSNNYNSIDQRWIANGPGYIVTWY